MALLVLFSMYLAITSFIYLIRNYKGKRNKENCFVFMCCLLTFALSTFYFVFEFLYGGKQNSIKSKFLCVLIPIVYETSITVSKVFSSLIFVYRYELINQRRLIYAPKISNIFVAMIMVFSVLHFAGQLLFVTVTQTTSDFDECRYHKLFIHENVLYSYFSGGCFILMIILQTILLVEIITPIYKHYLKSTTMYSSNSKLRNTLYRVVWCSIMLLGGDIGLVVAHYTTMNSNTDSVLPGPMLFIVYLFVDVLSLLLSYKDCATRLFPFASIFSSKLNEESSKPLVTETKEKATELQVNCTIESSLQLLNESQLS